MLNVKVTYQDDTYSVRSFEDQVKSTVLETIEFQAWFYWNLLHLKKPVLTSYGIYTLTDEDITSDS